MEKFSIRALHEAYREGRLRPPAVAAQAVERARKSEPGLFTCVLAERALAEAEVSAGRWQRGEPLGPLDGVPVAWKDLFDIQGVPTTAGSALRRHAITPNEDCTAVHTLTQCGAVNIGKVGLSEFAYSGLGLNPHYGTPLNPLSRDGPRAPGGSSSGSAVAVSAGIVPFGMGTDTGGSVRIPAAFNGLVGYRPSSGRLDQRGVFPLSRTLDVIGPIAHTVEDCAWVDAALRGKVPSDIVAVEPQALHFIVPTNLVFDDAEPETLEQFSHLLLRLRQAGAHVEHRLIPALDEVQRLGEHHGTITAAEAYRWHQAIVDGPDAQRIDRRVLVRLQRGRSMSALDLLVLQDARARLIADCSEMLADAWLLMPTVVHVAPLVAPLEADDELFHRVNLRTVRNTALGNFLDLCGISVPMGRGRAGMPLGALISGAPGRDDALFRVAAMLELVMGKSVDGPPHISSGSAVESTF